MVASLRVISTYFVRFLITGTVMGNIASTYSCLGMHCAALELKQRVLELFRKTLPEDHPEIGRLGRAIAHFVIMVHVSDNML